MRQRSARILSLATSVLALGAIGMRVGKAAGDGATPTSDASIRDVKRLDR